ncbi:MAG TPA: BON domain-containing protein [Gemmataceae bacterium]|nr:BON domain-containing protein [Gemmataceae bacterium]
MVSSPLVESRALAVLRQNPIPALRQLAIEETDEKVVIQGSVTSYYLKQLAQEALMPVLDGRALVNRVAVVRD